MNNPFQLFNHPAFGEVRVAIRNGEPWFVGKDAAKALRYARPDMAIKRHVHPMDKSFALVPLHLSAQVVHETNQCMKRTECIGHRRMVLINESGLYSLVLSANTPEAVEFKHWVTSEVLPALRTNGSYTLFDSTEAASPAPVAQPALIEQIAPDTPPVVEQTIVKTINAVDLADLVARMDALEEKVANMEFAFKELAAALNRNADAQLSKRDRATQLLEVAKLMEPSPERTQLFLQTANLINGKRLF